MTFSHYAAAADDAMLIRALCRSAMLMLLFRHIVVADGRCRLFSCLRRRYDADDIC